MPEVVREPIVVLYPSINPTVEDHDLICIQVNPRELCRRLPFWRTESFDMEFFDEITFWSGHDDF